MLVSWREPWNVGKSDRVVGEGRARVDLWNGWRRPVLYVSFARSEG
jgi:hypothetical protein